MKVCLINPPDVVVEDGCWDEPLGLLYIASALEEAGVEVQVLDLNFHRDWRPILHETSAEIYGVYCSSSLLKPALEINSFLRQEKPNAMLVVGGPHATIEPHEMAKIL